MKFGNISIKQSEKVKNLGVYMDSCLTFNYHIDELLKKVTGTLIFLNRVWDRFQPECRVMAVQALILSVLNYCLPVWGSTSKTQINRVQKVLNFAARIAIGGVRKYDHVSPIFEKLKWLKIKTRFTYSICLLIFKSINNIIPEWVFSLSTIRENRENRVNTRHENNLFIPRVTTDTGARNIMILGPKLWNQLPHNITNCQSINLFKSRLMQYLLITQNSQEANLYI